MGRCRKRLCSWRNPPSTGILGFVVPFMAVLGILVLVSPKMLNLLFFPDYANSLKDFAPPPDGGAPDEVRFSHFNPAGAAAAPPREDETPVKTRINESRIITPLDSDQSSNATNSVLTFTSTIKEKWITNLELIEANLTRARSAIRDAKQGVEPSHDPDYIPTGPVYWNPTSFHRSYLEMEKSLKVYVYEEGEHPIFHNGPCGSIYSIEGYFIYQLEVSNFRTRDPEKAHVYFLPFSVASIVRYIFDRSARTHRWRGMRRTVKDYVDIMAQKHPFWNRTFGYDHFMLSCHDWGPELSKIHPWLYENSIRALCNANTTEGFQPVKDVSIPEINLPGGEIKNLLGGPSPSKRSVLAFFAGGVHGPVRPILLEHWKNKDPDIQVYTYLPKSISYYAMLRKSKYCLCPSGYEVASPRMVEALYTGCVPVIIKDHYVPPFSDVLNWKSFAVEILVAEIPNLKKILTGISTRQYIRMQRRGVLARSHFEVNLPPKRYDVFHMILHSVWLRRLNVRLQDVANQ